MNDWRKVLRCRMSGTRAGRAWMVWAIWGMLGTAFTMEGTTGTEGLGGLGMAALLTAPFCASNFQNGTFFLSNRNGGYWLLPLASFQGRFWPQNSGVA